MNENLIDTVPKESLLVALVNYWLILKEIINEKSSTHMLIEDEVRV
jgi:hypothetical protein